jgi:hypothetical protein
MANAKHSWTERKRQIPDLFFRRGLKSTWFTLPSLIEVLSTHKTPIVVPRTRYLVLGSPYRPTEPWEYPGTTHPVPGWDPLVKQIHVFRTPVQDLLRNTAEQVLHHLLNQIPTQHHPTRWSKEDPVSWNTLNQSTPRRGCLYTNNRDGIE